MKITKEQLSHIIKEEIEALKNESFGDRSAMASQQPGRSAGPMEPDEVGVHRETIDKTEQLIGLKIQSLHKEVMRELEYGELKNLDRDETREAFYNAASDLRSVQASNAISAVVLKKLNMLDPIANLLEQIGDAIVAFGE